MRRIKAALKIATAFQEVEAASSAVRLDSDTVSNVARITSRELCRLDLLVYSSQQRHTYFGGDIKKVQTQGSIDSQAGMGTVTSGAGANLREESKKV